MNEAAKPAPPPELSVVLPFWNEGACAARAAARIWETLDGTGAACEMICVDDGSTDDTWPRLAAFAADRPAVVAIRFSRNFGKEAALAAGLEAARGRAVIVMDGDLQHPPELIGEMLRRWRAGEAEVVEAVKRRRGRESWVNRWGARLFYRTLRRVSGIDLENASDFKLLDRKVVDAWLELRDFHLFFRGMCAWLGFRRARIDFEVPERIGGVSKWSLGRLAGLAADGVASFSSAPLHLTTLIGAVFLVFAIVLGGHTLYMKLAGQAVSGFTTVILLLLIVGSCVLISLGVIGAYIARIFEQVKGRPRFLIAETLGRAQTDSGRKP